MKTKLADVFAINLRQKIKESGLTQIEIAKRMNLPHQSFTPWLKRGVIPSPANIEKLSEILDCEEYELFLPPDLVIKAQDNLELALKIVNSVHTNMNNIELLKLLNLCANLSKSEINNVTNYILKILKSG